MLAVPVQYLVCCMRCLLHASIVHGVASSCNATISPQFPKPRPRDEIAKDQSVQIVEKNREIIF